MRPAANEFLCTPPPPVLQTPSVFNGPLQSPWYQPRGIYVDPPTARLAADGAGWVVEEPASYQADAAATHKRPAEPRAFASRAALFDLRARKADVDGYRARVAAAIDAAERERPDCPIGAAVLEPVMHGAGGMLLVDPAFQRAVAEESQHRGIPVVADEVFAGLWRLGRPSAACALLGITPDIAAYGKLLTGGTVPLAATLASEEVFAAFEGNSKAQALLHGHSYTAHPVGCHVACAALDALGSPSDNPNLVAEAGEASSKGLGACGRASRPLCLFLVICGELGRIGSVVRVCFGVLRTAVISCVPQSGPSASCGTPPASPACSPAPAPSPAPWRWAPCSRSSCGPPQPPPVALAAGWAGTTPPRRRSCCTASGREARPAYFVLVLWRRA